MKEVNVTIGGNTNVLKMAREKINTLNSKLNDVEAEIQKYDKLFHLCPNKETYRLLAEAQSKKKNIEQSVEDCALSIRINSQKETFAFEI